MGPTICCSSCGWSAGRGKLSLAAHHCITLACHQRYRLRLQPDAEPCILSTTYFQRAHMRIDGTKAGTVFGNAGADSFRRVSATVR